MPRELLLGNGNFLMAFDRDYLLRELFYPYVGMDNQVSGNRCGIGCWEEHAFSWLDQAVWEKRLAYLPDTMVSAVEATNKAAGLQLTLNDAIHPQQNIFLRRIVVRNLKSQPSRVRLLFTHDFSLQGSDVGDTALYDQTLGALLHYKRDIYLLINGRSGGSRFFQYATGLKRFGRCEGTWRDAEDGWLEGCPIAHGSVDSSASLQAELEEGGEATLWYWVAVGKNQAEVAGLNELVLQQGPEQMLAEINSSWREWALQGEQDFGDLPPAVAALYRRSLLLIRLHCDNRGAILAAIDSDIMATAKDHYRYLWPRDGALIALALDRAGYHTLPRRFFDFCARCIEQEGYFYQKYNPDGTVGSSWHPRVSHGQPQLPIQEDETALVNHALWRHYLEVGDREEMEPFRELARRIGNFLLAYRSAETGLPLPSYDLWEERRGVYSFTVAAVVAGLEAAAGMAALFGEESGRQRFLQGAAEVRDALGEHLYERNLGRFLRGKDDFALDASLYGLFAFGCLPAGDPRVVRTMEAVIDGLRVRTPVGGLARYSGDWYFKVSDNLKEVPGNPWIITTLWSGEWHTARAESREELRTAREVLEWVTGQAGSSGVLPEQLHPYDGTHLSVAPLTWSHSAFVLAVQNYLDRYRELSH
jgi:GH15 family glucan-1,4-alpha-glucosidase